MISTKSTSKIQPIFNLIGCLSITERLLLIAGICQSLSQEIKPNTMLQATGNGQDKVDQAMADFWPKDESSDNFLELVQRQRKAGSIILSEDILTQIDEYIDPEQDISACLEIAAQQDITRLRQAQQNARDIEMINRRAEYLNSEARDVLEYQVT